MDYVFLRPSDSLYQSIYLPASPDGHTFQARVDLRYLPGPDQWVLSIADSVTAQVYVNQIPLICSYGRLNDLLFPFRYLFQGIGIGSFFCLKATDHPSSPNPSRHNLSEFQLIWGDRYE